MEMEIGALAGAPYGERSPDRLAQRNGYRWRANICVSPSRSTPVTTSTRRPSLRRDIVAPVQSSASRASAFTMPARVGNGAAIELFACDGTAAQSWAWNSDDGTLRALNKCLDEGESHWRRDCQRNAASALGLQRHGRSGMALATTDPTREPQSGRCLNVAGGSVADGERLQISDCDDTAGQVWGLP